MARVTIKTSSIPKENNKTNKKMLKIKHHSGLDSTQVRIFFKIKVLSEQQKGRVSESHWPKGRELYDLSLECFGCFGHNTRVPAIVISNIFLLSWQQTEPSSYTEDKHVSKPTMTSTSVLVHETWYQIHTGAKQTPVLFRKGMNIIKIIYIWIKLRQKLNWNHLYFCLPRLCFIPLRNKDRWNDLQKHDNRLTYALPLLRRVNCSWPEIKYEL